MPAPGMGHGQSGVCTTTASTLKTAAGVWVRRKQCASSKEEGTLDPRGCSYWKESYRVKLTIYQAKQSSEQGEERISGLFPDPLALVGERGSGLQRSRNTDPHGIKAGHQKTANTGTFYAQVQ